MASNNSIERFLQENDLDNSITGDMPFTMDDVHLFSIDDTDNNNNYIFQLLKWDHLVYSLVNFAYKYRRERNGFLLFKTIYGLTGVQFS